MRSQVVLSVDPGVRGCGCALFRNGVLVKAAYVPNTISRDQDIRSAWNMAKEVFVWVGEAPSVMVIECPRVYNAAHQKGDQNKSIIPLTLVVGALAGYSPLTTLLVQYFPRDWKGTVDPDEVMIPRIQARLTPEERVCLEPCAESLMHNVWDGIGVGLKYLGRLEPKRVFSKG